MADRTKIIVTVEKEHSWGEENKVSKSVTIDTPPEELDEPEITAMVRFLGRSVAAEASGFFGSEEQAGMIEEKEVKDFEAMRTRAQKAEKEKKELQTKLDKIEETVSPEEDPA